MSNRRANAKVPSRQREPGPSYILSLVREGIEPIEAVEVKTPWSRRKRERQIGRFLKGPIPLELLRRAAVLPGRALGLYILIRHRSDLRLGQAVTLPADMLASWGIRKDAKARALAALEDAGLITVKRRLGHPVLASLTPSPRP